MTSGFNKKQRKKSCEPRIESNLFYDSEPINDQRGWKKTSLWRAAQVELYDHENDHKIQISMTTFPRAPVL